MKRILAAIGCVLLALLFTAQQQNFAVPLSLNYAPATGSPGVLSSGAITPTPTAAAIGVATQTFTVTGLTSTDMIALTSGPAPTALCPVVGARATSTNTVSLDFAVLTAVACTPASGTYKFLVVR